MKEQEPQALIRGLQSLGISALALLLCSLGLLQATPTAESDSTPADFNWDILPILLDNFFIRPETLPSTVSKAPGDKKASTSEALMASDMAAMVPSSVARSGEASQMCEAEICTSCHQLNGKAPFPHAADFTDDS